MWISKVSDKDAEDLRPHHFSEYPKLLQLLI